MALLKDNQKLLGLDIGNESIKLIELQMTGLGFAINNFSKVAIPRDLADGQAINDSLALINTIRMAVQGLGLSKLKVAAAIKEQDVLIEYLTLPQMTNKELSEVIRFEIENQIPFPLEEATVDFVKIGDIINEGISKQEVMVVAVKKHIVEEKVDILKTAGVVPVVLDLEALAMQRMAKEIAKINGEDGAYAIINMGFATTSISVFVRDVLKFNQTLPIGGEKLTQTLCQFFKISYEEAEKTKKLINLTGEFQDHGVNILLHQKADVIHPVIENMIKEIKDCLNLYHESLPNTPLEICYLVGGCALFKGLDQTMEHELMMKVQVINPASFLGLAPHLEGREKEIYEAGPTLAVAIGLALSEV